MSTATPAHPPLQRSAMAWASACVIAIGLLAVVIWSESRTTSLYAGIGASPLRGSSEMSTLLGAYDRQIAAIRAALRYITFYSAAITVLSVIALACLWLRRPDGRESSTPPFPPS